MRETVFRINQKNIEFAPIVWLLVLVLFGVSKSYDYELMSYIAAAISVLFCALAPVDRAVTLVFFICPNTYFSMVGSSAICGWLAIICAIRLIIKNKCGLPQKIIVPSALLLAYSVFIYFINDNTSFVSAAVKIFGLMIMMGILPFIYGDSIKNIIKKLSNAYIVGAVVGACLGVLHYFVHGMNILATGLYSLRFIGLANDPNYLSATFCFAISLILVDFFLEDSTKSGWIYLIILSVVGFLTLSRAFIVCYILIIIVYFFVFCTRGRIKIGYLLLLPIAVLVAYALFYESIENVFNMVVFRFTDSQYSGGGGRLEVWEWYLTQFISSVKNFLFGSTPASVVYEAGLVKHIEHNTFIQLLYELGVVGSLIYIFTLYTPSVMYKRVLSEKKVKNYGIGFLPLIAVLSPYFFLSALTGENFILTFTFALIVKQCVDHFKA